MEVNNKSSICDIAIVEESEEKSLEVLPDHLLHQLLRFLLRFPSSTPHLEAYRDLLAGVKDSLNTFCIEARWQWAMHFDISIAFSQLPNTDQLR